MTKSSTTPDYWQAYAKLAPEIKEKARKTYRLWQRNERHPSLQFKKVGGLWSVRIDADYRALALKVDGVLYWFWIGNHDEYDKLISEHR